MLKNLENAFVINHCSRFDIQGREILKTQEKYYLADAALRYAVLGYKDDSVASMLENTVYLELRRRGYDVYVGKLHNYISDLKQMEVHNGLHILGRVPEKKILLYTYLKNIYQQQLYFRLKGMRGSQS